MKQVKAALLLSIAILFLNCNISYSANTYSSPSNIIPSTRPDSFANIVERTAPAVVNISTTQKVKVPNRRMRNFPDNPLDLLRELLEGDKPYTERQRKSYSLGSGFIIDPKGHIVTNYHVIDEADEIEVTIAGKDQPKTFKAKVVGKDEKTDLAVLKVDTKEDLPYLEFETSENIRVGDWVIAIGNPFGLGGTVTSGIISAKARYINSGYVDDYIQTDASINQGNSGGPMLNTSGKVIGVNSVIITPSGGSIGIGFAIPSSVVQPVVKQLVKHGKIVRGQLGVVIQRVTKDIANSLGMSEPKGALVADVMEGSTADKAGIKVGDVITKFDGKDVKIMDKLPRMVGETDINKKVTITVLRNGKEVTLSAVVQKPTKDFVRDSESKKGGQEGNNFVFGISVQDIDESNRAYYKLPKKQRGVVVTSVERGSPAYHAAIRPGDVIARVDNSQINNMKDLKAAMKKKKDKNRVLLLVISKGRQIFVALETK